MNKPVINEAGDREGLRECQKQKKRPQGDIQLVYHSSLKMGGKTSVTTQQTQVSGHQLWQMYVQVNGAPTSC
jgi:hypothetical protein